MADCPYCHGTKILYSDAPALHCVRLLTGSEKRYCVHCKKKWRVRRHRKHSNTGFYGVVIPLAIMLSLGMFKFTDQPLPFSSKTAPFSKSESAGMAALANLSGHSKEPLSRNHESMALSALQKMTGKSDVPLFMNKDIIAKVKKLEANPQALSKLSGPKREMAEQAIKFMKSQKTRQR